MTTTRRMVYEQIANAVLAGLPEPQEQTFDPATVWLRFDTHAAAAEWAEWLSTETLATFYNATTKDEWALACYYGERSDWRWSIVGRERSGSSSSRVVDGNERLPVRCPRCGHDEHIHGEPQGTARVCLGCESFCRPLVAWQGRSRTACEYGGRCEPGDCTGPCGNAVPAGVEGWAIDGRAT